MYPSQVQYGIQFADCANNTLFYNRVRGTFANVISDITHKGIGQAFSISTITCNYVDTLGLGFEFADANSGSKWYGNVMDGNFDGLMLDYAGVMGPQVFNDTLGDSAIGGDG